MRPFSPLLITERVFFSKEVVSSSYLPVSIICSLWPLFHAEMLQISQIVQSFLITQMKNFWWWFWHIFTILIFKYQCWLVARAASRWHKAYIAYKVLSLHVWFSNFITTIIFPLISSMPHWSAHRPLSTYRAIDYSISFAWFRSTIRHTTLGTLLHAWIWFILIFIMPFNMILRFFTF